MERLDLNALTDGRAFSGTVQALVKRAASEALDYIDAGFGEIVRLL